VGRPPLPIGTAGEMRFEKTATGYRARCKFRDYDGVTRDVERRGKTKPQARDNLKIAIRDRSYSDASAAITPDTKVADLAEVWFAELCELDRSPNTLRQYRDRLDRQVLPALGALRIREVSVARCDRLLKAVKANNGAATAKVVRTVVSGILGLAARHDALDYNPTRDAARITTKRKAARSLTVNEAKDLRARIASDPVAVRRGLPDFTDLMLATGMRIGEAAAVVKAAVDLDAGTVEVRGTVIRVKGEGLRIKPEPKSESGWRTLLLPSWAVEMLRRRMAGLDGDAAVFAAPAGGLRDPSNTSADLREAFDAAGYPWVTSHAYRRTVATLMDEAGLSARAAADQLGHARPSMTQDVYMGRRLAATGAAAILEGLIEAS
jgi:integrase